MEGSDNGSNGGGSREEACTFRSTHARMRTGGIAPRRQLVDRNSASITTGDRRLGLLHHHMSYEELLALQERIGNAKTGLSNKSITECLKAAEDPDCSTSSTNTNPRSDSNSRCAICQCQWRSLKKAARLVECGHGYHESCIRKWLHVKTFCPLCRTPVEKK